MTDGEKSWTGTPGGSLRYEEAETVLRFALDTQGWGEGLPIGHIRIRYSDEPLSRLTIKLRAISRPEVTRRVEPDVELLLEAGGLAMRPGPRPKVDTEIVVTLRQAILASRKVRLHYQGRGTGARSRQLVCPYGFLYGNRPYLVAYSMNSTVRDYRLFSLANISTVDLTEFSFARRGDFSLAKFTRRSFGVFQEEPFDVVWRFKPEAAADAREWLFHPSQTVEDMPDGSLIVRFHAGGALEMSWHLYTWGDAVEVIEPENFWNRAQMTESATPDRE